MFRILQILIVVLLVGTLLGAKDAANSKSVSSDSDDSHTNADALVQYGPYGVALNEFSVDKDGQIDYPVFVQTVRDGEKNGLEPCEDFYEFVTNGALRRKEQNKEAWTRGKYPDISGQNANMLLLEETITFWKTHLVNAQSRKEFPADERSEKMFTFYDKCREKNTTASDKWTKVLGNIFRIDLSKGEFPTNVFDTDWMERTFPFNPFFEITRIASKQRAKNDGRQHHQQPWVFGSEIRIALLGTTSRERIEEMQKDQENKLLVEKLAKQQRHKKSFNESKLLKKIHEIADAFIAAGIAYNKADAELGKIGLKEPPFGTYAQEKARIAKLSLGEMQTQFPVEGKLNWLELVQRLFPDIKAEDRNSTVVVADHIGLMRKYVDLIGKYAKSKSPLDKAAFSNFLLWSLIDLIEQEDSTERSDIMCLRLHLYNYFPHPLTELFFRKMKLDTGIDGGSSQMPNKTVKTKDDGNVPLEPLEMYRYVKKGFEKMLQESSWFDEARRKMAMEILEKVYTTVGMQSELPAPEEVYKNLYTSYTLNANMTWLEMLVEAKRKWSRLVPFRHQYYTSYSASNINDGHIAIGTLNLLLPSYNRQFPAAYNFGTMGFVFGHEFSHFLQPSKRPYHELESSLNGSFWSQQHVDTYNTRESCFAAQYKREFEKIFKNQTYANSMSEDVPDNVGIVAAFYGWQLYEEDQRKKGVPAKNPFERALGNKYSPKQVFFMAFAYSWLEYLSDQDPEYFSWRNDPGYSPNRLRVNLSLRNFPAFSEAFKCKPGQSMNPAAEKCFFYNN